MYCPSLKENPELLRGRTCPDCGLYFCSKKAVTIHKSALHKKPKKTSHEDERQEAIEDVDLTNFQNEEIEQLENNELLNDDNAALVSVEQNSETPWIEDDS